MSRPGGKKQRKAALEAQRREEQIQIERVLGIIERAFDGVLPPDDEHRTLHQAEAWDGYRRVDQRRDHGGRWQDLPASHIDACPNALYHLDEQGIAYYLPALMSHVVAGASKGRYGADQSLRFTLQPATGDLKDHQSRRFSRLTLAQREAILAFLEHVGAPEEERRPWRRVVDAGDDPRWFRRLY